MNKIPKIVHYCWFGHSEKSKIIHQCMQSWKKHLPDYEFKLWNELNFNINNNLFVKQAYENKQWAFVSDYVRFYALYNDGGIYLDTDLELFQSLNQFLTCRFFTSFDHSYYISQGIIGTEKNHPFIKKILDHYQNISFINSDGTFNNTANSVLITNMFKKQYGLIQNNKYQNFNNDIHIYPYEYFCVDTGYINCFAKHHFNSSWCDIKLNEYSLLLKKSYLNMKVIYNATYENWYYRLNNIGILNKNVGFIYFIDNDLMLLLQSKLAEYNLVNSISFFNNQLDSTTLNNLNVNSYDKNSILNLDILIIPLYVNNIREIREYFRKLFNCLVLSIEDITGQFIFY